MSKFVSTLISMGVVLFWTVGFVYATDLSGTVKATMNGDGYTYVKIEKAGVATWVAVPETDIDRGSTVTFKGGMPAENLTSKDLEKTFKKIFISTGVVGSSQAQPSQPEAKDFNAPKSIVGSNQNDHSKIKEAIESLDPKILRILKEAMAHELEEIECLSGNCQNGQGVSVYSNGIYTEDDLKDSFYTIIISYGEFNNGFLVKGSELFFERKQGQNSVMIEEVREKSGVFKPFYDIREGTSITKIYENGELVLLSEETGDFFQGLIKGTIKHIDNKRKFTFVGHAVDNKTGNYREDGNGMVTRIKDNIDRIDRNGTLTWENGDVYEGDCFGWVPLGQGKMIYANGDEYTGEFDSGKPNGEGTKILANGVKYTGDFQFGKAHGNGTLWHPSGEKYIGQFDNNIYQGKGTLFFSDGSKYVGEFFRGKITGYGTLYWADGRIETGAYLDGKPVSPEQLQKWFFSNDFFSNLK